MSEEGVDAVRIVVTGGSGFVGAHLCRFARSRHDVIALWNKTPLVMPGVRSVQCDLTKPSAPSVIKGLQPDAIVHLAYKIKGAGEQKAVNAQMMASVLALGLPTVYGSSTVVHWPVETAYSRARKDDEALLAASGLPWVSLRPSAPFGPRLVNHSPSHKESFHTLSDLVRRSPIVPIIGTGHYLRQPIFVDDFSCAAVELIERGLPNRAFDVGGRDALSFNEVVSTLAVAMGKRIRTVHLPKAMFVALAPFTRDFDPDLIRTLDVDDVADPGPLADLLGWQPRSFKGAVGCLVAR